jgi:hypothetical protein
MQEDGGFVLRSDERRLGLCILSGHPPNLGSLARNFEEEEGWGALAWQIRRRFIT